MCCVIHLAGSQESEQEDDIDDMEPSRKEDSLSEDEIIPGVI